MKTIRREREASSARKRMPKQPRALARSKPRPRRGRLHHSCLVLCYSRQGREACAACAEQQLALACEGFMSGEDFFLFRTLLLVFIIRLNAICSYSAWHGTLAARVRELVVAASGFLGVLLGHIASAAYYRGPHKQTGWYGLRCS